MPGKRCSKLCCRHHGGSEVRKVSTDLSHDAPSVTTGQHHAETTILHLESGQFPLRDSLQRTGTCPLMTAGTTVHHTGVCIRTRRRIERLDPLVKRQGKCRVALDEHARISRLKGIQVIFGEGRFIPAAIAFEEPGPEDHHFGVQLSHRLSQFRRRIGLHWCQTGTGPHGLLPTLSKEDRHRHQQHCRGTAPA